MSMGDRTTVLAAAGAVSATLGVGSWSTNVRIDDVQADIRELRAPVTDVLNHGNPAD